MRGKVLTLGSDKLKTHVVTGRVTTKRTECITSKLIQEKNRIINYTQKRAKNGKKKTKQARQIESTK